MHTQPGCAQDSLRASGHPMLTIDRTPLRCLKCGSTKLTPVGHEMDLKREGGYPALEFVECECNAAFYIWTLVKKQETAPKPKPARNVRHSDPEPSQQAAQLDFTGRRQQVVEALTALGTADTQAITEWINTQGHKPTQRNTVARRLNDLETEGVTARAGEHANADGHTATLWRLTEISRRQAA